jgi:gluconolactonase
MRMFDAPFLIDAPSNEESFMLIRSRGLVAAAFCLAVLVPVYGQSTHAADAPETVPVEAGELHLTVPKTWQPGKVSSNFRKAQMKVPKAKGDSEDAEFVVYYFDGGGGGIDPNVQRWVRSFQPSGRKVKVTSGKSPQGDYVFVDLQGTWNKPIGPMAQQRTQEMPNARTLSVILTTKEGNYFVRLTGPKATVDANADAFRTAFGGEAKSEKDRPVAQE